MSRTERLGDLTNARQAQADKKWKQAIAQADDVLARFPDSDEAKQIKQKATTELAQAPIFERFQRERLAGKVADAVVDFRKLSATSVYKSEAQPLFDKMRDSWLKDRLSEAKRLADQRNCDQVRTLMSEARDLFPDDIGTFSQVNRACLADTVQRLKQYNADADLRSATLKLKRGRWAEARSEADKALEYRPDEPDALAVAATAACQLHDKEAAIQYIARLKADPRVSELKEICAHEGIILE